MTTWPASPASAAVTSLPDIDAFEARATALHRAARGLSRDQLLARPVPGTWSIQQIIVHILESDLAMTHRLRRIAAEDNPLIIAYDETRLADRLAYDRADVALVAQLFELNRRFTAAWLRTLEPAAFHRTGIHNLYGKVALGGMVRMYVEHVDHHMGFVAKKRAMLGAGPIPD